MTGDNPPSDFPMKTVRRRTRHHPVRRRRRRAALGMLLTVVLAASVAALIARDALAVRSELNAARDHLTSAARHVARGETTQAADRLAEADRGLHSAETRTNRLLWHAGESVPLAGRSLRIIGQVVDLSTAAVDLGIETLDGLNRIGGRSFLPGVNAGQVDLERIEVLAATLHQVDLDRLTRQRDDLAATDPSWVPAQVRSGRQEALTLADRLVDTIRSAEQTATLLPELLGAHGPRRYLLAIQNSAELRGTGGLVSYHALLTADRGELTVTTPEPVHGGLQVPVGQRAQVGASLEVPRPVLDRYGPANLGSFSNVNLDPDLPTVAPILLDLYRHRTGELLDGVFTIDPVGLQVLLEPIGPIDLPDGVGEGQLPDPVRPAQVAEVVMVDAYDALGGGTERFEAWQQAFARAALDAILGGGWEPRPFLQRLLDATAGGHLQLFSVEPEEQRAIGSLGTSGRLVPPGPPSDLLAVTMSNASCNKVDTFVGHSITADVTLGPPDEQDDGRLLAEREMAVDVGVANPIRPGEHDAYLDQSCPLLDESPTDDAATTRTWTNVWSHPETRLQAASDGNGERLLVSTGSLHGLHVVDDFIEVPSLSDARLRLELAGPAEVARDGPDLLYELHIQRQPKAVPDRLVTEIAPPPGWAIANVEVAGGGGGGGMGINGAPGPPLSATSTEDRARITGDMSNSATIRVRLTRPLLDRLRSWLSQPALPWLGDAALDVLVSSLRTSEPDTSALWDGEAGHRIAAILGRYVTSGAGT